MIAAFVYFALLGILLGLLAIRVIEVEDKSI